MGCRLSRVNGCYAVTCCCCLDVDEACSWVAAVSLVWDGVATLVNFISANLPEHHCPGCLDHALNAQLSLVAGCINAVQWLASVLLLIGAKLNNRWLLLPWLAWGVVSLAMQVVWLTFTLPRMPSVRATTSLFQLAWGAHFFLVVKTQYTHLALTFTSPEEDPLIVPPNTPVRKHKRRWRRMHPACQPAIRTLVGAALRLQRTLQYAKKVKELEEEEEKQEREEDEEEEEETCIAVTVHGHGGVDVSEEETSSRRRGRWKEYGAWEADGSREQGVRNVIVHSSNYEVSGKIEETGPAGRNNKNDQDDNKHKDEDTKEGLDVEKNECENEEAKNEREEAKNERDEAEGKAAKNECKKERNSDKRKSRDYYGVEEKKDKNECKKEHNCDKRKSRDDNDVEEIKKDEKSERRKGSGNRKFIHTYETNADVGNRTNSNVEINNGRQCKVTQRDHNETMAVLFHASSDSKY